MTGSAGVAAALTACVALCAAGAPARSAPPAPSGSAASTWNGGYELPLGRPIEVARPFDPPTTAYGPGHLGVDLRAAPQALVRTAAPGTVQFAGPVAGRGVVVVLHPDGIRTEYEPLRPLVHTGGRVAAGAVIGTLRGRHRGCAGSCLHWGARRGDAYLDPLALLGPLGAVVLVPSGN